VLDSSSYQSTVVVKPKVAAPIPQVFVEIFPLASFWGFLAPWIDFSFVAKPSRTITQTTAAQ